MLINTSWYVQLALIWRPNRNARPGAVQRGRERAGEWGEEGNDACVIMLVVNAPRGPEGIEPGFAPASPVENCRLPSRSRRLGNRYRVHEQHLIIDDRFLLPPLFTLFPRSSPHLPNSIRRKIIGRMLRDRRSMFAHYNRLPRT